MHLKDTTKNEIFDICVRNTRAGSKHFSTLLSTMIDVEPLTTTPRSSCSQSEHHHSTKSTTKTVHHTIISYPADKFSIVASAFVQSQRMNSCTNCMSWDKMLVVVCCVLLLQTKLCCSLVISNSQNNMAYANYWENLLLEEHR